MEDPGYPIARRIMADFGLGIVPVPVDADGMNLDERIPPAHLAYVTPTYQMPLGVRLADRRCKALIEWALREDAWIVEDDYDSEFRYAGEAIAALQGADPSERVIYLGTFSRRSFRAFASPTLCSRGGSQSGLAIPSIFMGGSRPCMYRLLSRISSQPAITPRMSDGRDPSTAGGRACSSRRSTVISMGS